VTPALRASIKLTRYTSTKASLSYAQYEAARASQRDGEAAGLDAKPDGVVVYA
jgi:hypothetical protein